MKPCSISAAVIRSPTLRGFIEAFPEGQRSIGSICDPSPAPEKYTAQMEEILAEVMALCAE